MNTNLLNPIQISRKRTKRIILMGVTGSLLLLTIKSVRADISNFLGNTGIFGDIISQLTTIFPEISSVTQWVSLLQNTVNDPCQTAPILLSTPSVPGWCTAASGVLNGNGSISSVLAGVAGVMGLPDPSQARATIQQNVMSAGYSPDVFITAPTLFSQQLGNVSARVATSINSQTVLSTQGQQQTQNLIDQITQTDQTIATASDTAQSATSTQDVVKAIARINAQQAVLSSIGQVSALKSRTDAQFTNLNLTNISDALDQQNRQRLANSTTDGYMLLNLTAQSKLF